MDLNPIFKKMGRLVVHLSILFSLLTKLVETSGNETAEKDCGDPSKIAKVRGKQITEILNNLQDNYDKRVRPNFGEEPVSVGVTMFVLNVVSVSEVEMDFTIDFYFRQSWADPRLKFRGSDGLETISIDPEFAKTFWMPDTVFSNEKKSYFHDVVGRSELFRISADGNVHRSTRLTVTASCPMDLSYFPMDSQLCSLNLESYRFTNAEVRYYWANGEKSIKISPEVSLPQFKVLGHKQKAFEENGLLGNYSHLVCWIKFSRPLGYYLIQIYIPAGMIVITSWVSFWLNKNSSSARVAHGVTTVLTMATLLSSANATLPKISYVKAMDVYLAVCFFMVFASLLENATVGFVSEILESQKCEQVSDRQLNKMDVRTKNGISEVTIRKFNSILPQAKISKKFPHHVRATTPDRIDNYSRILFPVFFVVFNIVYWITYLNISNDVDDDLILLNDKRSI